MKPVSQTIHDANGGNCLTASIASLLEIPIHEVPNFAAEFGDGCLEAAKAWLANRGYSVITIGFASQQVYEATYFGSLGTHCILTGPSSFPARGHAVVGRVNEFGAIEITHDPAGGRGPLPGHRWVHFIIGHEVQGPAEEIGTGVYRLADGQVCGNDPDELSQF